MDILVKKDGAYPAAKIHFGEFAFSGVIGKNGVVTADAKKEGDQATPSGEYKILAAYFRPDKVARPETSLPLFEIGSDDIWVDDTKSPLYNQPAKLSKIEPDTSHERLFRDDHLYDIFLDIDYNRNPAVPGKGSAIFMHIARDEETPSKTPTAGCVALKKEDLLRILDKINLDTKVVIEN